MCLILFAWRAHAQHALIVAANRDEFHERPALPANFWSEEPRLLAGRDLQAQGTWMGVTRSGRFAAITNFRNPAEKKLDAPSRGGLVSAFLIDRREPSAWLQAKASRAQDYNGFSILAGDRRSLYFFSNRDARPGPTVIDPGIHGLSNHLLDTPWPKVEKGKERLAELLSKPFSAHSYLELLADREPADAQQLPDTGVGAPLERRLSAIRIVGNGYGTRCSTVLRISEDGSAEFWERTYVADGSVAGTVNYAFSLQNE